MRKGLFFGAALLASMLFGGTAFADRADETSSNSNKPSRGREIKEQVLEKMKEGRSKSHTSSRAQNQRRESAITDRVRPKGDVYGDQATRGSKTKMTTASGRNMSASNKVNTPREIKQMLKMINPLFGAYRTSQAAEGADSYGGDPTAKALKTQDGRARNMSNSNKVNTPREIKQMLAMINPMFGAYRTSAASENADSYGGSTPASPGYASSHKGTSTVHFKNDKGEVIGQAKGDNGAAKRVKETRERMNDAIKAKMEKAKQ